MADAAAQPRDRLTPGRLKWAFALLLAVLAVLTAFAAYFGLRANAADNREHDITGAEKVATRTVVALFSISYQTFDTDVQRMMTDLDTKARGQVAQGSTALKNQVVPPKLVSQASPYSNGIINISGSSADVAVAVTRTASATTVKTPVTGFVRYQIHLVKQHGRWLVDGMAPVQ